MKLIIEDEEGRKTTMPFAEGAELTIGRQEDNAIRLSERNVSRKHARLIRRNGQVLLEDLGSYCGVSVNKQRIKTMVRVSLGDVIQIGDYDLTLEAEAGDSQVQNVAEVPPIPPEYRAESGNSEKRPPANRDGGVGFARVPSPRLSTAIINLDDPNMYKDVPVVDIPIEQAPRLVVESGDRKGTEYALIRTVLTLGRDYDNDIPIDHRSLSRHHCRFVRLANGEWKIVDTDSANGVEVNGEKYGVSSLTSGDSILVGKVRMSFYLPGARKTVVPEVAKAIPPAAYAGVAGGLVVLIGILGFLAFRTPAVPPGVQGQPTVPQAPTVQVVNAAADLDESADRKSAAEADDAVKASENENSPASENAVVGNGTENSGEADGNSADQNRTEFAARQALEDGNSLMVQEKYSEAMVAFAKAVEGKVPGAQALLEKATSEAAAAEILLKASDLIEAGKLDEALTQLERISDTSSRALMAKELKAQIAEAKTKTSAKTKGEAKAKAASASSKKSGKRAGTTYNYGSAYMAIPGDKMRELDAYLGDMCDTPGKAMAMLKRLIKENPDYGDAYMFLGTCYAEQGQPEVAERYYRTFLKRWPKHPDAQVVRANIGR